MSCYLRKVISTWPPFLSLLPFLLPSLNSLPVPLSSPLHQEPTQVIEPHYTKEESNLAKAQALGPCQIYSGVPKFMNMCITGQAVSEEETKTCFS